MQLYIDVQLIDNLTCKPMPAVCVDVWIASLSSTPHNLKGAYEVGSAALPVLCSFRQSFPAITSSAVPHMSTL